MSERHFESELKTLYAQPVWFADASQFSARLDERLRRHLRRRILILGGSATLGGAVSLKLMTAIFSQMQKLLVSVLHVTGDLRIYWFVVAALLLLMPIVTRIAIDDLDS